MAEVLRGPTGWARHTGGASACKTGLGMGSLGAIYGYGAFPGGNLLVDGTIATLLVMGVLVLVAMRRRRRAPRIKLEGPVWALLVFLMLGGAYPSLRQAERQPIKSELAVDANQAAVAGDAAVGATPRGAMWPAAVDDTVAPIVELLLGFVAWCALVLLGNLAMRITKRHGWLAFGAVWALGLLLSWFVYRWAGAEMAVGGLAGTVSAFVVLWFMAKPAREKQEEMAPAAAPE